MHLRQMLDEEFRGVEGDVAGEATPLDQSKVLLQLVICPYLACRKCFECTPAVLVSANIRLQISEDVHPI